MLQDLWETRAGRTLRIVGLGSVRTTILTLAVLATLIPALATGWISYRQNRRAIEAKLNEQLATSSTQAAREMGLWLKERLYDLRVFAASYEVTENVERGAGGSRRLPDYLNSVNDRFPDYDELMVVAPDLRTVASTGRVPGRLHFTGSWLQQARMGDHVLGLPLRADSASATTMEVAVPIVGVTGRFLGVLAARLNFNGVGELLRALVAGRDGRLVVVRPDGQAIASIGGTLLTLPEATLRRLEQSDSAPVAYGAPDGVAVLGALAEVPGTDWRVVAEIPAATAYFDIRQLRNTTVLLVLVLLLVVGSLAYGLGLLIVLPLERLSRAANRVAGGDLDVDVPASGGGELAQLAGVFNDMVRRLREGREELERLSLTDELTGLANRRALTTELERELRRADRHGRACAVLMLDVDRFKRFNDTYGHPAGDAVLRRVADILRGSARDVDTVARYGGEEFLVILPETATSGAALVAERIRASAEGDRFTPNGGSAEVGVTVSIGYAVFPEHARTPETLIEAADQALYRAKEGGRNRVSSAQGPRAESPKARKGKAAD
jgi:diguanylate cyclase (GGDEF)-like protein